MAVNDPKEVLKGAMEKAVFELSPEQMSLVNGGTMTSAEQGMLYSALKAAKASGISMETVIGMVPGYYKALSSQHPNVTQAEVIAYINSVWASL